MRAVAVLSPNHLSGGRGLYRVAIANCDGPEDTAAGCNTTESLFPDWEDVGIPGNNQGTGDETSYGGPPISASIPITVPKSTGRQLVEVDFAMSAACVVADEVNASGICDILGTIVAIPASGPEIYLRPATPSFGWTITVQGLGDWTVSAPDRCPRKAAYPMVGSAVLEPGQYTIVVRTTFVDPGDPPGATPVGWVFGMDSWQLKVSQYLCSQSCS